jgi:AcrR family transcriptional regulator
VPTIHPDRGPAAAERLVRALEVLQQKRETDDSAPGVTISELCRLAGVSRNCVYRYHPTILAAVRGHSGRDENVRPPTPDFALLQDQLAKLVALVDHYYSAYRETLGLLERRERELAALRRKLNSRPAALRRQGIGLASLR